MKPVRDGPVRLGRTQDKDVRPNAGHIRAAVEVLRDLKLYEHASAGCIAQLAHIIARETST